ncbi:hypothetical protein [Emcibacter sp.]|uniref:hypothetical protein n=1 Tax=Emcibacter sp. TaxID=1979954 RepID=UPI002AA6B53B|nr:hypothetical protein [Emcibacter sp.]
MGAFLIIAENELADACKQAALTVMSRAGFTKPQVLTCADKSIYLYDKLVAPTPNLYEAGNGDFCFSVGTLFFDGSYGVDASEKLLKTFSPARIDPTLFDGSFAAVIARGGKLYIFGDPLGTYRLFHSDDHKVWGTSFLAAASTLPVLKPNPQAIYEYVFQGATYGNDTPFHEVKMANSHALYEWDKGQTPNRRSRYFNMFLRPIDGSQDELVDYCLEALQNQFQQVVSQFGNNIDTALSGGYDSRLMLALLRKAGSQPKIHVYGADNDPDVVVAKTIAKGENLHLVHKNKAISTPPAPEEYPALLAKNFFVMDGIPNEGIFDNGLNLETRRERVQGGALALNGGGGEIYRDFFHLPDQPLTIHDMIRTFYSQYDPASTTEEFTERLYRERLALKIRQSLDKGHDQLNRIEAESIYPLFRLRYWMGKNNSLNNRFGPALTPFTRYSVLQTAMPVPLRFKYYGNFEAAMIRKLDLVLAGYLTDYGYSLSAPAPLGARIAGWMDIRKPIALRQHIFAFKNKFRKLQKPFYLNEEYVDGLLDPDCPRMSRFFRLDKITSAEQFNRLYSLEYLMKYFKTS